MAELDSTDTLVAAASAVQYAQDVRAHHRKRTKRGNPQREADLKIAQDRLHSAMEPVRTYLGRLQFEARTDQRTTERIRAASVELQRERRKLWKMQSRNGKEPS